MAAKGKAGTSGIMQLQLFSTERKGIRWLEMQACLLIAKHEILGASRDQAGKMGWELDIPGGNQRLIDTRISARIMGIKAPLAGKASAPVGALIEMMTGGVS